jgi:hypothetical protein
MIDTFLNLIFRCPHQRLSRPVTLSSKPGQPNAESETYVVCLDCGKHFAYDTKNMQLAKRMEASEPARQPGRWKFALWASAPLAVFIGKALKGRKPSATVAKRK